MITRFTLVYRNAGGRLQLSHIHNSYEYVPAGETPSLKLDLNTLKFVRSLILKQHSGKRIAVRSGNQTIFVDPYTVLYVQSQNKRTELVCADQVISCNSSLSDLARELPDIFYPLHRGYYVNALYITAIRRFEAELDLDQVESVILGDLEYPVDSSGPVPAELDESLRPFVLYYPGWSADDQVPAAELCSRLGAGCHWDREAGTVTITYRGHTAVLTVGTEELVVDGAEEMTFGPTVERDGQVYLNWKVCDYLEIPCQSMTYALRIMPPGLK